MSLTIRSARAEDAPLIFQFVNELAEFEKLSHEVVATEEDIRKTMFGQTPRAFCVIAEWEGKPAGFALFYYNYSTFLAKNGLYLEDLYVREEMRGYGIGKALLAHLAAKAKKEDCGRLEWWVLDWNKASIDFYESLGAQAMKEWTVYRLSDGALNRMAEKA